MDNNLIELAKLMFEDSPKDAYAIQMQYESYDCIEDLFEVLLHLFIYGYKIKEMNVNNINELKPYFKSIGVNFSIEMLPYSELEFVANERYLTRYCNIMPRSFVDYEFTNIGFMLSRNYISADSIDNMRACYIHEIPNNFVDSFICFISFNFKIYI